ncbi:Protein N-methyltransferase NNT1-like protein 2 [Phlyctema vagabunda]|uniref:Protein N-terminal and lysine N-methyltransferase EFM7 n=1 Tax=Phlyctema vagabunda TaxID=108571 RepID=A0ABR4PBH4_9HELO
MANNLDHESDSEALDIFADPEDYYPPSPKPTTEVHTMLSGSELSLRLVGHNPLWGHHLWNAGRVIAIYLENNENLIRGKAVLELGAGAGLPSMICGMLQAEKVIVTDYPDPDLVSNLWTNIEMAEGLRAEKGEKIDPDARTVVAEGYCWGADVQPLTSLLNHGHGETTPEKTSSKAEGFDVLILADLLFNHSEHAKLVSTIQKTLSKTPESKALVFFTPYRPWLYEKDMAFFDLVKEAGFTVEKILEEKMAKVMFEKDPGDEELRRTVFGYEVRWAL